uniref:Actin n=1 Tax=Ascaris lumbricoides TaxID=6252 RepID=A0A9J2Q1W2_ASCLU
MDDVIANQPVVIDNGSGIIKAGFAGDQTPKCRFANFVGRPKHTRVMIFAEEHPVLLTEAPLNPLRNREKSAEIFFETFNVPALHIQTQAVLSLYSTGRTTGVVLDSGDGVTHIVPIFEGFAIQHGIERMDVAGRDVTRYLRLLLRKEGADFHRSAEFEIVREIKERLCYVAANAAKEESSENEKTSYKLPDGSTLDVGAARFRAAEVLFRPELIGEEWPGIATALDASIRVDELFFIRHQLASMCRRIMLIFFITFRQGSYAPILKGNKCSEKCDMDLRKILYSNIVLSGGSTMFAGFGDRLLAETRKLAPKDVKIRISAPQERLYGTWIGGSILASSDTFKKMWASKKEYEDEGKKVLHRKTF